MELELEKEQEQEQEEEDLYNILSIIRYYGGGGGEISTTYWDFLLAYIRFQPQYKPQSLITIWKGGLNARMYVSVYIQYVTAEWEPAFLR